MNNIDEATGYEVYRNSRYGYSISYPNNYKVEVISDSGDGIKLSCDDGGKITAFGSNNISNKSISEYYNESLSRANGTVTYKTCSKNEFVISYEADGYVYYQCTCVGAGSVNTFIIKYPESRTKAYDEIVTAVYKSFKTPEIGQAH